MLRHRVHILSRLCVLVAILSTLGMLAFPLVSSARPLAAGSPVPTVTLTMPTNAPFIGANFTFTATFDNTSSTDVGYGPYIDLIMPTAGIDGSATPGNTPYDGLTFNSATFLGTPVTTTDIPVPASGCIIHPYAVDATGAAIQYCGLTEGDHFVVLQLPFGSFTPGQTPAIVTINATVSNLADLKIAQTVQARGGFQFGSDPLSDPSTDPTIVGPTTTGQVSPILIKVKKTYIGPEDETSTGPNFPRQYELDVDIAPGQTITNLNISDAVPGSEQFVSLVSSTPSVSSSSLPSTTVPGGNLSLTYNSVTGTGGIPNHDVKVIYSFYVPLFDASNNRILDPNSGACNLANNQAAATGDWTPLDARDPALNPIPTELSNIDTLNECSVVIQKSVDNLTADAQSRTAALPGDTLKWTLNFQVSDFFSFDKLQISDTMQDGQTFVDGFIPTMAVNLNPSISSSAPFHPANYVFTIPAAPHKDIPTTSGTTPVIFNVSNELISRALPGFAGQGKLIGGCVNPNGTDPNNATPNCPAGGIYNNGGVTGTITFETKIDEKFLVLKGGDFILHGDAINNNTFIYGNVLNNTSPTFAEDGSIATNNPSSAGVIIGVGGLVKTIYAITRFGSTTPTICYPCSNVQVMPGDQVTYRFTYTLPSSDFKALKFVDYVPLPVFQVNKDSTSWTFNPVIQAAGGVPAAGTADYGDKETLYHNTNATPHSYPAPPNPGVTMSSDVTSNSLTFDYGDFSDDSDTPTVTDILFTVTAQPDPFADDLFLTNEVTATEQDHTVAEASAIVMIKVDEPVITGAVKKGVVATDHPTTGVPFPASFSLNPPAPVTFSQPGTTGVRWTGTINSAGLAAHPIDSNLSGADAGDLVTFAIVIDNTGHSGAYDIKFRDDLPSGYHVPGGGAGLNLTVTNGAGTVLPYTILGSGLFDPTGGISLNNPGPTTPILQAGETTVGNTDVQNANGTNIAIATFDLQVDGPSDANPATEGETLINSATLFNYAGEPGADSYPEVTDTATVSTPDPKISKTLVETSIDNGAGSTNDKTHAVIGETVQYDVLLNVPEGITPTAQLTDTLDPGLAIVSIDSITVPSGITSSVGPFTTVQANTTASLTTPGQTFTVDFGTLTNSNTDNTTDTIDIKYTAVVLDVAGNVSNFGDTSKTATTLKNSAGFTWGTNGSAGPVSAAPITVIEPKMQVGKAQSTATADAGDTVNYTLDVSHVNTTFTDINNVTHTIASDTDAYDVVLFDQLPAGMTYTPASLTSTGLAPTSLTYDAPSRTISAEWDGPFAVTDTSHISFAVTLDSTVTPTQTFPNTGDLLWTSLPGNAHPTEISPYNFASTERDGSGSGAGGVDNYNSLSTVTASVPNIGLVKTLISTSLTGNGNDNIQAVIGEQVTYTMVATIPEGTTPTAAIVDTLPAGLAFVQATNFAASSGLTSDTGFPGLSPTVTNNGQTITWNLGTVTNSNRDNSTPETISVTFVAVVLDVNSNVQDTTLTNSAKVTFGTNKTSNTATSAPITVVEPKMQVVKSVDHSTPDSGDTLTYTLDVSHVTTTDTDAYDVVLTDTIPTGLTYVPGSATSTGALAPTSIVFAGGTLTAKWDSPTPFKPTDTAQIQFQVTVDGTVNPTQTITNPAELTWTSLPGDAHPTTISTFNSTSTERDGSTTTSQPDNYYNKSTVDVTVPNVQLTKTLDGTSINNAANDDSHAVIGEKVTYTSTITIPEGVTPTLKYLDTLDTGLAIVSIDSITASAPLTTDKGSFPAVLTAANTALASPGQSFTVDFGSVTNSDTNNASPETIVIGYTAVVLDVNANVHGTTLNNTGKVTFGTSNTVGPVSATAVTVIEPKMQVVKTAAPSTPDAGDPVAYTLNVSHVSSDTDAYDVVLTEPIPTGLDYVGFTTLTGLAPTSSNFDTTTHILTLTWDGPFATTDTSSIQVNTTVDPSVAPNQPINNTADLQWTSLPGDAHPTKISTYNTSSTERDGSSGLPPAQPDDYDNQSTAGIIVANVVPVKSLIATSETSTADPEVTIGEVVRYHLAVQLPETLSKNFQLIDHLPAGMSYLNDGTTDLAFVCNSGPTCITSSTAGLFTGTAVQNGSSSNVTPTATLSSSAISGGASDGAAVTFSLGDLQNNDSDSNVEYVVVDFNALTDNVTSNQAFNNATGASTPTTLNNTFDVSVAGTVLGTSAAVPVDVAEPVINNLSLTTPETPPFDAGDQIHYVYTFSNTATGANASTAFDADLTDTLPFADFATINPGDIVVTTPTGTTATVNYNPATGQLDITFDKLPPASTIGSGPTGVTVSITATLASTVTAGQTISDSGAKVVYTSLPGTGTSPNPTGSTTPGATGAANGERNGADGVGGTLNDYASTASISTTLAVPTIVKNAPTPTKYTIGQQVTYPIVVTLPEGITKNLIVHDVLPTGMTYISNSLDTSNYGGTVSVSGVTGTTGTITFTFGDTTTAGDNDTTNNSFTLNVVARVDDVSANHDTMTTPPSTATTLTNSADMIYDQNGTTISPPISGGSQTITVIEPQITTTKTANPTTGVQAGSVITYTVDFANTGNSPAYDVTATDVLAPSVTYNNDAVCKLNDWTSGSDVQSTLATTVIGTTTLSFSGTSGAWDVPVSTTKSYIECIYTVTVQTSAYVDGTYTNTADANWHSLDSTDAHFEDSRSYNDAASQPTVDGTQDTRTASFTIGAPTFAKSVNTAAATIGDTVQYTLTITSPKGTIHNLTIADTLPKDLTVDSSFTMLYSGLPTPPGGQPVIGTDGGGNQTVTWTYGDTDITGTDANNPTTATIVFQVIVRDTANNARGQNKTNSAAFSYSNAAGVAQGPFTRTAATRLREPILTVAKTITSATPTQAGQSVTYQVVITNSNAGNVSTAYDVSLDDVLPTNLTNLSGITTASTGTVTSIDTSASVVNPPELKATIGSIAKNSSVTINFTATLSDSVSGGETFNNIAPITWTSTSGTNPDERNGTNTVVGVDNYDATSNVSFTLPSTVSISKSTVAIGPVNTTSKTNATIGETVTYGLVVNLPEGTNPLTVIDTLPSGMQYSPGSATIITTAAASSGLLTSDLKLCPSTGFPSPTVTSTPPTVNFDFGNICVDGDGISTNNSFLITFQAQVLNVAANHGFIGSGPAATNLQNIANAQITGQGSPVNSNQVSVLVVEPQITTTKTANPTSGVHAGSVVTYTVDFTNSGKSKAFDVTATDVLAPHMTYNGDAVCKLNDYSSGTDVVSARAVTVSGTSTLSFSGTNNDWDIPALTTPNLSYIECIYSATAQTSIVVDGTYTNTVDANWNSEDNGFIPAGQNRVYDDGTTTPGSPVDGTQDTKSAQFSVDAPTISKSVDKPSATIGEILTYTLTINAPTGTLSKLKITDPLPTNVNFVTGSSTISGITPSVVPSYAANTLVWDWTAGPDAVVSSSPVTIQFQAMVVSPAVNGNTLTNGGNTTTMTYTDAQNNPQSKTPNTVTTNVVEPHITPTKSHTPPGDVQAGDTLTYTVKLTNDGTSEAFDTTFTDALAQGMTYNTGSAVCTLNDFTSGSDVTSSLTAVVTGTTTLTFGGGSPSAWDIPLTTPTNSYISCSYTTTAQSGLTLDDSTGASHVNTATPQWSSLDGEPTGSKQYTGTPVTDQFTTAAPTFAKSEDISTATIGNAVNYTLTITSPTGTIRSLVVTDTLPADVTLDTGTAMQYAGLPTPPAGQPVIAGQTITWTYGDAVISSSPATIKFRAIVRDTANDLAGQTKTNNATMDYHSAADVAQTQFTASTDLALTEPSLSITKTVGSSTYQNGQTVSYQVVITNATGGSVSDAYDTVIDDPLPSADLQNLSVVSATGSDGTVTGIDTSASTGTELIVKVGDIPPGKSVTVDYTATLTNAVAVGTTVNNTANVKWTSTSGTNPDERNGTNTVVGVDNYSKDSSQSFTTTGAVSISKDTFNIAPVNPTAATSAPTSATIGETITYALKVTIPEGTNPLTVVDTLPSGVQYISGSVGIITSAATSKTLLSNDFALCPPATSIALPSVSGGTTPGEAVTLTFPGVCTDTDNDANNNSFLVTLQARVLNIAANHGGNTATALLNNSSVQITGQGSPIDSNQVETDVIEPQITTAKTITSPNPATGVKSGDTIHYTVDFTNTGNSKAFDVTATDVLAQGVSYNNDAVCTLHDWTSNSDAQSARNVTVTGTTTLTFSGTDNNWDIPYSTPTNSYIECTYTAAVLSSVYVDGTHTNTVDANWNSEDNGFTPTDQNRVYDDGTTTPGSPVDGTQDTKSAQFSVDAPTFAKSEDISTATIGNAVNYTLTITSPTGTIRNLVVTDTLPADVTLDTGTAMQYSGLPTPTAGQPVIAGQTITWTYGDTVISSSPATIKFRAIVRDTANDLAGQTKTNNATMDYDNAAGVPQTTLTGSTDLALTEPSLSITKTVGSSTYQNGQTVSYQLVITNATGGSVSDAYDTVIDDPLPSSFLQNLSITSATGSDGTVTGIDTSASTGTELIVKVGDIPPGKSVTVDYTAKLTNATNVGTTVNNTANVKWTSTSGANPDERNGTNNVPGVDNYSKDSSQSFTTVGTLDIDKATMSVGPVNTSGVTKATIGETVTYGLVVTVPEGTNPITVVDALPTGMQYISSSAQVVTSAAASGGLLSNDYKFCPPDTSLPTPTITGGASDGDDLTFAFIGLCADSDGIANNNSFLIKIQAHVLDDSANHTAITSPASAATVLPNSATVQITGNNASLVTSPTVNVTVVEPQITTTKTITSPNPAINIKAGDAIDYAVQFKNTGDSEAFDVTATDVLAQGIGYNAASAVCTLTTTSTNPIAVTTSGVTAGGITTISFDGNPAGSWDIPVNGHIDCTYTGTAQPDLALSSGTLHTNTVDANWTSLDGAVTGERNYNDTASQPTVDGTQDTATASFTTALPELAKTSDKTTYIPGDVVTFTLTLNNNGVTGSLDNLVVKDTLPSTLGFISGSTTYSNVNDASAVTGTGVGGDPLTWTWASGNPAAMTGTATITFTARVLTTATAGLITNNASLDYTDENGTAQPQQTTTHDVTIQEPNLTTAKTVNPTTGVKAGGTLDYEFKLTNNGTSTAYGVQAFDTLASHVTFVSLTGTTCALTPDNVNEGITASASAGTVTFTGNPAGSLYIPVGSTLTCDYTATADTDLVLDPTINYTNTVNPTYNSQDQDSTHTNPNKDFGKTYSGPTATATFTSAAPTFQKDEDRTTFTIGEKITYTLTVPSSLGSIRNLSIKDVLPSQLDFVTGTDAISGFTDSTSNPVTPTVSQTGQTLTWDFGTGNTTVSAGAKIVFQAVVANTSANNKGDTKQNNAELDYTDSTDVVHQLTDSQTATVVEPQITTTLTINPSTGVQGGDNITYTATFENTGNSTAYDVTMTDILAPQVTYNGDAVCTLTSDSSSVPVTVTGTTTLNFDGNPAGSIDIAPGDSVKCVYTVKADSTINIDSSFTNTVDANWSTLNGAVTGERVYDDGTTQSPAWPLDGTQDTKQQTFTTGVPTFSKSVAPTTATIGDKVTYTLTITSPKGTIRSLNVTDTLPADVELVSGTFAYNGISTPPAGQPTVSGQNITWAFGDAVLSGTSSSNPTTATITYDAIVKDTANNANGQTKTNHATLSYNNDSGPIATPLTASSDIAIVEPHLTIAKALKNTPAEANDVAQYEVTLTNDGTSDAFDVHFVDSLPQPYLDSATVTSVTPNTGVDSGASTGTKIDITIASIPKNGTVTIDYTARLTVSISTGQVITNTANVDWTSTNGANPDERNGTNTVVGVDNYTAQDSANFTTGGTISLAKHTLSISPVNTSSTTQATIGETVTYGLVVTMPQGTNPAVVTDSLPAGMLFVPGSVHVVASAAGSNGQLSKDFGGTVPANPGTDPTVTGGATDGAAVTFTFSSIVVNDDSDTTNNSFLITFQATVQDDAGNKGNPSTALDNGAKINVNSGPDVNATPVTVNVVEPQMAITKTFSQSTVGINSAPITVTLKVDNTGNSDAYNVTVDDPLPDNKFANLTAITTPSGFTFASTDTGGNLHATYTGGTIAKGGSATFTFSITTTDQWTPVENFTNTATVSTAQTLPTPDTGARVEPPVSNTAPLTVTAPDLEIVKTAQPLQVTPNGGLVYTLTVTNHGPIAAVNTIVSDILPTEFAETSISTTQGLCANAAGTVTCNLGTVNFPGTVTIKITGTVAANVTAAFDNTATVTTDSKDRDGSNNSSKVTVTPSQIADLEVTKDDGQTTYTDSQTITYTIKVINHGPSAVTNAGFTDNVPSPDIAVTNWTCTTTTSSSCGTPGGSTNNITDSLNLINGGVATFTVTGTVKSDESGDLTNTATITYPNDVTNPNLHPTSASDTDGPVGNNIVDLKITKDDGQTTYTAGGAISYTILITNNGPADITGTPGATFADTVPASITGVTAVCSTTGTATCGTNASTGNSLSFTGLTIKAGAGNSIKLVVSGTVDPTTTGNLANTATVTTPTGTTDSNPANNTATDTDTSKIDLAVTKDDNLGGVYDSTSAAVPIQYTIVLTNNGPAGVTGATVSDTVPATIGSVNWTCGNETGGAACGTGNGTGNTISFGGNNLPAGSTLTIKVNGTIPQGTTTTIPNTVTVSAPAGTTETNLSNNTATDTVVPTGTASVDLAITKDDGVTTYALNDTITYHIVVSNNGPSDATNATVTDTVPSALTNVSWTCATAGTASCGPTTTGNGNSISLTGVDITQGAGNTVTLTVTGKATSIANPLINSAHVDPATGVTDRNTANNTAVDSDTPSTPNTVDLSITKDDGQATYSIAPGNSLTYHMVVTNHGPSVANGAHVTDSFPAGETVTGWTCSASAGASCTTGTGSGNIDTTVSLPVNGTATFSATVTVADTTTGPLTNTAHVDAPSGLTDTNPNDNTATDTDGAPGTSIADLSITKTDGTSSYTDNGALTYTIVVKNSGPAVANNALVNDTFTADLTSPTWTCGNATGGATCGTPSGSGNISNVSVNLPVGAQVTFTVHTTVSSTATGMLSNTATVTPPTDVADPNSNNNTATDTDNPPSGAQADLEITKTDNQTMYNIGAITYTIVVSNHGPNPVTNATVTDNFPPSITGGTWNCSASSGSSCNDTSGAGNINTTVNLLVNGTATYTVSANVAAGTSGALVNTANVNPPPGIDDPNGSNNIATDTDTVSADLAITKNDGQTQYHAGQAITYTIVASNNGPSDVSGATVTDFISAELTNATWTCTASAGSFCVGSGAGNISTSVNLLNGGSATFVVTATVVNNPSGDLVNTATINAPTGISDPNLGNNQAQDRDTLPSNGGGGGNGGTGTTGGTGGQGELSAYDPVIVKEVDPSLAQPGENVNYKITVSNKGTADLTNVTVSDPLPSTLTVINATQQQGSHTVSGNTVTFHVGTLTPGQTVILTITARVRPDVVPPVDINNIATLTADQGDKRTGEADTRVTGGELPATGQHPDDLADMSALWFLLVSGMAALALVMRRYNETIQK